MQSQMISRQRKRSVEVTGSCCTHGGTSHGAGIQGVDLFCGAGGLTAGLEIAGIKVRLGIDVDPACEYPYTENNNAQFLLKSVEEVSSAQVRKAYGSADFRLLAGCAPCQPFSTYSQAWSCQSDKRWNLLEHFSRFVLETRPHLVTMENVPPLAREKVYANFTTVLRNEGFEVFDDVVNCADYGVPQERRRLVLLASRLGPIQMISPTTPKGQRIVVRRAIGDLPPLEAGQASKDDPLHKASRLSRLNLARIRASKPDGTWHDWHKNLRAACHQRKSGKTYSSVYGRMSWNHPSPTITTQFYGFGNGRFGHPKQHRAISIREGAILQSFPREYKFVPENGVIRIRTIGRLIGNAVPVKLGAVIGKSIVLHVEKWRNG